MQHRNRNDTGNRRNAGADRLMRIERMGTAVDEIVAAFTAFSEVESGHRAEDLRKLAAASRRLWMLARRLGCPRSG